MSLAYMGTEIVADSRREKAALAIQVLVLALASGGAIVGGVVTVLNGIGVTR